MVGVFIRVDAAGVRRAFERLEAGLRDARPLMREVAFLMADAVAENFAQGGRPTWLGLASGGRSTLQDTGRLRNSIVQYSDATAAIVGTNLVYAAIHQFGGEIKFAPRSGRSRLRTDARGNLLRQGESNRAVFARDTHTRVRTVRWTNAGGWTVRMPARPFLHLTEADNREIEGAAQNYLRDLIDPT